MKKQFLAALMIILALSTVRAESNGGRGGGNVEPSTRQDLEEITKNFIRFVWESSDSYLFGGPIVITRTPLTGSLLRMTRAISGTDSFAIPSELQHYLASLRFNIIDAPCMDAGEKKDASTSHHLDATICLSATRLSRFPKSQLRAVLLPLIFHEVAHQYGFQENDAKAFQTLAEIYLKYRPIYLATLRSEMTCGYVTNTPLTSDEVNELKALLPKDEPWPAAPPQGQLREATLMYCASHAAKTGEELERYFNGDIWSKLPTNLTTKQQNSLLAYSGRMTEFTFETMTKALLEPPQSGYEGCRNCSAGGIDPAYIMMLGSKAALFYIDNEVARLQGLIH